MNKNELKKLYKDLQGVLPSEFYSPIEELLLAMGDSQESPDTDSKHDLISILKSFNIKTPTTSNSALAFGDNAQLGDIQARNIAHNIVEITNNNLTQLPGRSDESNTEEEYRAQLLNAHSRFDFIGIPDLADRPTVALNDIYIPLRSIHVTGNMFRAESMQFAYFIDKYAELSNSHPEQIVTLEEEVIKLRRIVILGDPGSGKTALIKRIINNVLQNKDLSEGDHVKPRLPIYVPLAKFISEVERRANNYSLCDFFYTYTYENLLLNINSNFFETELQKGNCIVLMDGLDETSEIRKKHLIVEAIESLCRLYPNNTYLVTSRGVSYSDAPLDPNTFHHFTILPFSDADIAKYIKKWHELREPDSLAQRQKVNRLISAIMESSQLRSLAATPLLLAIIVLIHRNEAKLPAERAKLYDKCVEVLLEKWDDAKGIVEPGSIFFSHRRRLLEQIAAYFQSQLSPFSLSIKKGDLELLLAKLMMDDKQLDLAENSYLALIEARSFIAHIKQRTGLLVERGQQQFGFPHLTFQEYLCASSIVKSCIFYGVEAIWNRISRYLYEPNWHEVILLVLGSLNSFDEMPSYILNKILDEGMNDEFEPIIHRHLFLVVQALGEHVQATATIRKRIIKELTSLLRSPYNEERQDALNMIAQLPRDEITFNGLLQVARDKEAQETTRIAAIMAFARLGYLLDATRIAMELAEISIEDELQAEIAAQIQDYTGDLSVNSFLHHLVTNPHTPHSICEAANIVMKRGGFLSPTDTLLMLRDRLEKAQAVIILNDTIAQFFIKEIKISSEEHALQVFRDISSKAIIQHLGNSPYSALQGEAETSTAKGLLQYVLENPIENVSTRCNAAVALGQLGYREQAARSVLLLTREIELDEKQFAIVYRSLRMLLRSSQIFGSILYSNDVQRAVQQYSAETIFGE